VREEHLNYRPHHIFQKMSPCFPFHTTYCFDIHETDVTDMEDREDVNLWCMLVAFQEYHLIMLPEWAKTKYLHRHKTQTL